MRFGWCDLHGVLRGKTLTAKAAVKALRAGVGMVSTLLLKDTSDRTAFKVFEPGGTADLPGFAFASNLILLPDPASQAAAVGAGHRLAALPAVVSGRHRRAAGHAAHPAAGAGAAGAAGLRHGVRAGGRGPTFTASRTRTTAPIWTPFRPPALASRPPSA